MSVARSLGFHPDREKRRRAFEAELTAWEGVAVPLAAALNSIKGITNTLNRRRGWDSALDLALFNNSIDRETLEAMQATIQAAFPDFRRYLTAKARALGLERLAWYDLGAPVGGEGKTWSFDEAISFLLAQFGNYSPRMQNLARRAFAERWIDAEPRPGKRDGAFCMMVRVGESRILTNFKPSYDAVSVMAHELGHAYQYYNLVGRTALQRPMPMTLAETASTFCETIVRNAALAERGEAAHMEILEAALQDATQKVVDITSRVIFETGVFETRQRRELSVAELNELMLDAQRQTYGNAVDPLHPYMWAVKVHYYSVSNPYYNFPYAFGLLFGLGLYARYRADPERFKSGYDDLLSSTALADAATLAQGIGIDIRRPEFWGASLDVIRDHITRFEELAARFEARSSANGATNHHTH
jgi:pepF/M3 family oligoendopeptidase